MNKKDCLQIGTIVKTHGVSGEVILEIKEPVLIELVRESVLLEIDGLLVPFFIAENRQTSNERLRIRFERVTTENHSKILVHCPVYLPLEKIPQTSQEIASSPSILIGFSVTDKVHGELGIISEIAENSGNPVMIIVSDKREILIPFHRDLIIKINSRKKNMVIETPDGLIDLYL